MKYMGSKRAMLQNGLGILLTAESLKSSRIVDLFCGSASVAWFAATKLKKPVAAFDLQEYSAALAGAVIRRVEPMKPDQLIGTWLKAAKEHYRKMCPYKDANALDGARLNTATWRARAQSLCSTKTKAVAPLIWSRYGGHYFSPTQALGFDAMLQTLPNEARQRDVCLAATIVAASQCVASPGHTAQPFKATRTAGRYLREAWLRDPYDYAHRALENLCPLHAVEVGEARVANANDAAKLLLNGDVVFVDPPYSGVHYSRFYHVLETIARGKCGEVEGIGRYPSSSERPNSAYSRKDSSAKAIDDLLKTLSNRGCRVVLTFPRDNCSNGLSGEKIENIAAAYFRVMRKVVKTRFSTLGGNIANRAARNRSDELIFVLNPKT